MVKRLLKCHLGYLSVCLNLKRVCIWYCESVYGLLYHVDTGLYRYNRKFEFLNDWIFSLKFFVLYGDYLFDYALYVHEDFRHIGEINFQEVLSIVITYRIMFCHGWSCLNDFWLVLRSEVIKSVFTSMDRFFKYIWLNELALCL